MLFIHRFFNQLIHQKIHFPQKFGTIFKLLNENNVNMEMRKENNDKRRRKIIRKCAELVRSVKPGHNSVIAWEKETSHAFNIWKVNPAA